MQPKYQMWQNLNLIRDKFDFQKNVTVTFSKSLIQQTLYKSINYGNKKPGIEKMSYHHLKKKIKNNERKLEASVRHLKFWD